MKRFFPLIILLALGACSLGQDPFSQPGTWEPTYDNDANLRAMVANPHDLIAGEPMQGVVGAEAVGPVGKLLNGKRAKLPDTSASSVYAAGGGSDGGGAAGGSNGGS